MTISPESPPPTPDRARVERGSRMRRVRFRYTVPGRLVIMAWRYLGQHFGVALILWSTFTAAMLIWVSTWSQPTWFDEHRLGSAGDWFTGIVTAGTLAFLGNEASRRERNERAQRDAAQANQVTAWPREARWEPERPHGGRNVRFYVRVHNSSSSAVYHVAASITLGLRPGEYAKTNVEEIMPPGETADLWVDLLVMPDDPPFPLPPKVALMLVDARGQYWLRRPDGRLTKMPDRMRPRSRTPWDRPSTATD